MSDKYDAVQINRMLWRVRKGNHVVGQARKGLDNLWYAEVGDGDRSHTEAIHRVIIATEAIEEFRSAVDG
jgi:hypothetical protein